MIRSLALILATVLPCAGPGDDLDRLQGPWKLDHAEFYGNDVLPCEGKWTVRGDELTIIEPIIIQGTFTLDPTKSPARFERTSTGAGLKSREETGIYKIEGDTFTLCSVVLPGKDVPSEFPDLPERGYALEVWQRSCGWHEDGIDGAWKRTEFQLGGIKSTGYADQINKEIRLVIKENIYTLRRDFKKHVALHLNPTTEPKQIDMVYTEGPLKGERTLGIYRLDGDRLTICTDVFKRRPVDFSTKPHSLLQLRFFQRVLP